jgi:tetratricopeptide (TPR) repeat protein
LFSYPLAFGETSEEDGTFRVIVSSIAVDDQRLAEEAGRIREAIERVLQEMDEASRVRLIPEIPKTPVTTHDEALALREAPGADAVIWGRLADEPEEHRLQISLSLLRPVDLYHESGVSLFEFSAPARLALNLIQSIPYDSPARLGPWSSPVDDLDWLATTLGALVELRDGSFATAARKLEALAASRPDLKFYQGVALVRRGKADAAEALFRQLADDDPKHVGARLGLIASHHREPPSFFSDRSRELIHEAARVAPLDARINALVLVDVAAKKKRSRDLLEEHLWRVCRDPEAERMSPEARSMLAFVSMILEHARFKGDRLIDGPLQCAPLQLDLSLLGHESLGCMFASVGGFDLPACVEWEPDPYTIHPVAYMGFLSKGKRRVPAERILEVAEGDPNLGSRAGLWGLASAMDDEVKALEWIDERLEPGENAGPSLLAKGLLQLAAARTEDAAETLAAAQIDSPDLERDRRRHLGLALTALGRAEEALEVLEREDRCERAFALAGEGRFVEAFRALRRCEHAPETSVMEVVSEELERDEVVRRLLAAQIVRGLVESLEGAQFQWNEGLVVKHFGWDIDPITLPGTELTSQEQIGLSWQYGLPLDLEELIDLIRELPSTEAGRAAGFTRDEAKMVTERLSARAESFVEDRGRDVWPRGAVAVRLLEPRWKRMFATGRDDQAADDLGSKLVRNPSNRSALVQLAALEILRGNPERTVAMLDEDTPELSELKLLATASSMLDATDDTRRLIDRARKVAPADADVLALEAMLLDDQGSSDEALERMRLAIELAPDDPYLWAGLGLLHSGGPEDCASAVEPLERSLAIFPGYGVAKTKLGYCYEKLDRFPEAEEQYRRALEIYPDYTWARRRMASVLEAQDRYGEAAEHLEGLLELDPENRSAWSDLAYDLRMTGRYAESERAGREAIRHGGDGAWVRRHLGYVLRMQGKLEESTVEFGRALELEPESTWALRQQGWVLAGLGREAEAEESFRKGIEVEPDDRWTRIELAQFLGYRGRTDEARQVLLETLEKVSDDDADASVGLYLWVFGYPDDARRVLQEAIEENGGNVRARIHMGRIHRREGRSQLALQVLEPAERKLTSELAEEGFDQWKSHQLAFVQALTDRKDECRETMARIIETVAEILPDDLYDLGCIAAVNGDVDRSLDLLGQAFEAGYRNFDWAKHDPDLAGLTGNPRFESLLKHR